MPSKYDFPIGVMGATAAAVLYTLDYFIGPEYMERSDIIRFVQNIAQMILFLAVSYGIVRIVLVLSERRKRNPRPPRPSRRANRRSRIVPDPTAPPAPENVKVIGPEKPAQSAPGPKNRAPNARGQPVVRSAP